MSASSPLPASVDVVVIGAGSTGIAAGRRLKAAGVAFIVLEARDRIGGRAHTIPHRITAHRGGTAVFGLDMGCGWLHSADENVLTAMGREAGFTIDETPPPWRQAAFGLGMSGAEREAFGEAFEAFGQRVAEAARAGRDLAASALFAPSDSAEGLWNARMDAISGAMNGARFAEVSTVDYDAYRDTEVNFRVVEGYGDLIAALGARLPVVLDCPVTRIDRSRSRLTVETPRGAVDCAAVVLTVPTSLIASGVLRIDPPVSGLIEAAANVPLGLAAKLHIQVEHPEDFPKDSQLWGRTETPETGGYHLRPFGRPMIESYFGGDLAWGLEDQGEAAFFDFAASELISLLGSDMRRRIAPVATSMWGADPWSRGAYSHCLPGHGGDRLILKQPIENRLFIAGEATAQAFYGTAHGAWMEGGRAAVEAIEALGIDPRASGRYDD